MSEFGICRLGIGKKLGIAKNIAVAALTVSVFCCQAAFPLTGYAVEFAANRQLSQNAKKPLAVLTEAKAYSTYLKGLVKDDILNYFIMSGRYDHSAADVFEDALALGKWVQGIVGDGNRELQSIGQNIGNGHEWVFGTDVSNNVHDNFPYYYAYYFALKDYYTSGGRNSRDIYSKLVDTWEFWGDASKADSLILKLYQDLQPFITTANNRVRAILR